MKLLETQSKTCSFRETSQKTTIILPVRDGNGLDQGSAEKTEADLRQILEEGLNQCRPLVITSDGRVKVSTVIPNCERICERCAVGGGNGECSQRSSQQKVGGSALNMWSVNTLGDIRVEMYNTEPGA